MNTIQLTPAQTEELYSEGGIEDFNIIERGSWDADDKIQTQTSILLQASTNKFFSFCVCRSGSPFTDWHYSWNDDEGAEIYEVESIPTTTYEWKAVQ